MGLTGKYDFPGFQKLGRKGAQALFSSTPWLAWIPGGLRGAIVDVIAEVLANKGLVLLNGVAFVVEGKLDTDALNKALGEGIERVDTGTVTPAEGKAIDEAVKKAARKALPYGKPPKSK